MRSRESVDSVGRRGRGGKWNALAFVSREARRQGSHREESAVRRDPGLSLWTVTVDWTTATHRGSGLLFFMCFVSRR